MLLMHDSLGLSTSILVAARSVQVGGAIPNNRDTLNASLTLRSFLLLIAFFCTCPEGSLLLLGLCCLVRRCCKKLFFCSVQRTLLSGTALVTFINVVCDEVASAFDFEK